MAYSTEEQILKYIQDLTKSYGHIPNIAEAATYTSMSSSKIGPADVVSFFGANNWDDAILAYVRYLNKKKEEALKQKKAPIKNPISENPRPVHRIYNSREALLQVLKEMYIEFDGYFTVQKVRERTFKVPTPSYTTLYKYFGPPENWAKIVEDYISSGKAP